MNIEINNLLSNIKHKTHQNISVYILHSGLSCQRNINYSRVLEISSEWNDILFEEPLVNFKDGEYRVIDGQHTIMAYKNRLDQGLITEVNIPCTIVYNLTDEQENALYLADAVKQKAQTYDSRLLASFNSGNTELLQLNDLLNKSNFALKCNKKPKCKTISCTQVLLSLFSNYTAKDFGKCLELVKNIWWNDSTAITGSFLQGLFLFYKIYKNDVDWEIFQQKMRSEITKSLISESQSYENFDKTDERIAYTLLLKYNKPKRGVPQSKKLKVSLLEEHN